MIDFGQVKQIGGRARETLSKVMCALDERESDDNPDDLDKIGTLALELGVELADDAPQEGPAAGKSALVFFDDVNSLFSMACLLHLTLVCLY